MNLPESVLVLAQNSAVFEGLRGGFRQEPAWPLLMKLLVGAAALFCLILLGVRVARQLSRKAADRPQALLYKAAAVLQLSHQEREDVRLVAERARLDEPAALLLSPANLAHGYREACAAEADETLHARLDALSQRVFQQPLPAKPQLP